MQVENWGGTDNILKNNKWYTKRLFVRPKIHLSEKSSFYRSNTFGLFTVRNKIVLDLSQF